MHSFNLPYKPQKNTFKIKTHVPVILYLILLLNDKSNLVQIFIL